MPQVVLYIAASIDAYIARSDGNLDWLTSIETPKSGGDYGYTELLNSIGTTIMGRKTYEEVLKFGIDWPYTGLNSYVLSNNKNFKIETPDTYLLDENLKEFIGKLKMTAAKDIWLIGGGELIASFLNDNLIDKMIITIIPKIIGEGIPLFPKNTKETLWKLHETISYDTGVVSLIYLK